MQFEARRAILSKFVFIWDDHFLVSNFFDSFFRKDKCDKTKCPGPLAYYEALGCKPVYEKEDDCCATKYNCNHLKERSKTKCYVNGKEYEIGESLKEEDANPCDIACTCTSGYDGM